MAWKILLAEPLSPEHDARLRAAATVISPAGAGEDGLIAAIGECDAIIGRTHTPITARVIAAGSRLRVIGVAGVGLDRVDLAAAEARSIRVIHTPAASTQAVAELAAALVLQILRPVARLASEYRAGRFLEARAGAHGGELRDLTVGIIGMGRIGSRFGRICAAGFGSRVIYHDIAEVGPFDFAAERAAADEVWAGADVVSLHVPLDASTRGMVGAAALEKMKPTAILVNTARGAVVDTPALVAALQSGRIAAAGLDVTDPEPLAADHPLLNMPNCIVTPHIAARTHGGLQRMCDVVDDVLAALRGSDRPTK
ncbi:MAG: hypothetical protein IT450_13425 [Phycisphaerales bacterium]|nr:hypothetical protein [Phycisphaerales bacterium]